MLRCGYLSPEYVASQAECGQPLTLPRSGGWLLERRIPGSEAVDRLRGHVAAFTAITAVRPAEFNELLPPERDAAIAAIA